ncbi:transposase [Streptomyces spectabilis]
MPHRWTIERSIDWLMHHRRLARDYERHPHRSEAMIHLAMIDLMARPPHQRNHPKLARHLTDQDQTPTSGPNTQQVTGTRSSPGAARRVWARGRCGRPGAMRWPGRWWPAR